MAKIDKDSKKKTKVKSLKRGMRNFPVGDFLVSLKNASLGGVKKVEVPVSKLISAVAKTLKDEGYIEEISEREGLISCRVVYKRKEPVLSEVKLISKPGLRVYIKVDELEKRRAPSILIISTPLGVMSSRNALKKRLGGEVIAEIL